MEITEQLPPIPVGVDEAEFINAARTDTGRFAVLTERSAASCSPTAIGCWRPMTMPRT